MSVDDTDRPWEAVIGLRVGALTGGLLGALIMVLTDVTHFGIMVVAALLGGFVGWRSQRRNQRR